MLCKLLVQGAGRRREITDMCLKPLDRFLDEAQLAKPNHPDPIESEPICLHDCLNVLALARKYRFDFGSREREPIIRHAEYHKPALLHVRVCHGSPPRRFSPATPLSYP